MNRVESDSRYCSRNFRKPDICFARLSAKIATMDLGQGVSAKDARCTEIIPRRLLRSSTF